jgi:hypothetical protein
MEFKLKTKGFSMDINLLLNEFSMEFQLKIKFKKAITTGKTSSFFFLTI